MSAQPNATHFGDPCIHCGVGHDDVPPGSCLGDGAQAIPIAYRSLGVRWDGVAHYLIRMSNGEVKELHSHISFHAPYYHFGHSEDLINPPRYDANIQFPARSPSEPLNARPQGVEVGR